MTRAEREALLLASPLQRWSSYISNVLSVMQKFEKVPESEVVFDADMALGVGSKVPGSGSPLMQCLAGEGGVGTGPGRTV